jgi:hypothetical protein
MRCSFVGGILAGLMVGALGTGVAAAPEPSARLATIEAERRLVASAGPDDHARLRDHFARLADRSMANARGYRALAQSLMGNPKSSSGWPRRLTGADWPSCRRGARLRFADSRSNTLTPRDDVTVLAPARRPVARANIGVSANTT